MFAFITRLPSWFFLTAMAATVLTLLAAGGHDPAMSLATNGFGWVAHTP